MKPFLNVSLNALLVLGLLISGQALSLRAEVIYWPLTALDQAKQRSDSLDCVRNLEEIVRAARRSSHAGGPFPDGILKFTNQLTSPAVLFCPADAGHQVSTNWADFDSGEIDYEWIPQANWDDPTAVCCRCRLHKNVAQADGSVTSVFGFRTGWPAIVAGPLGQDATPGSDVRFEVALAPDALLPVTYQWQRQQLYFVTNTTFYPNPEDPGVGVWRTNRQGKFTVNILSGETNSSYVIASAQIHHSDYYRVVVRNALGAAASSGARLFVDPSISKRTNSNQWSAAHCVNNLKQIALFGGMMATDNDEQMPQNLFAMTNSYGAPIFGWPVLLYCRFDAARTVPVDWAGVDLANTSYEVLPGDSADLEAVFCRCKAHGFYAKMDGSVVSRPFFSSIRLLTNNSTELNFTVFAGQTNVLESATNLEAWATLNSYPPTNRNWVFQDTNSSPQQFYRIRTQ